MFFAAATMLAGAVLVVLTAPPSSTESARAFVSPHGPYGATVDDCAICHRGHTGQNRGLLSKAPSQSQVCLLCHGNPPGANNNVLGEYQGATTADNPATSSYYRHSALTPTPVAGVGGAVIATPHTSRTDQNEFKAVLNRHTECTDCHDPHSIRVGAGTGSTPSAQGWTDSGALTGSSGATGRSQSAWLPTITYEYQLCMKCHSNYTTLYAPAAWTATPSSRMSDKGIEVDPTQYAATPTLPPAPTPTPPVRSVGSYHPIDMPGVERTGAQVTTINNNLAAGTRYTGANAFTYTSTIRCTHCHGVNLGSGSTASDPAARLAPHASNNRALLAANYRDRLLHTSTESFLAGDFALCFLCHSSAPYADISGNARTDTDFRFHGFHLGNLPSNPSGSTDINVAGAGQGDAICAECHFNTHGTKNANFAADRSNPRLVNFAPDVQPSGTRLQFVKTSTGGQCYLTCHGVNHGPYTY